MPREQHKSPCKDCPFSRGVKPNALGGNGADVYVGQAGGSFMLPCHSTHNYKVLEERLKAAQPGGGSECAGAAIFRANVGVEFSPRLLHLPQDHERVFASYAEFFAHHEQITLEQANAWLDKNPPALLTLKQFDIAVAKSKQGTARVDIHPK